MSKLLLDDEPLIVLPSLATAIGLNESIFLQQLHYWLQRSKHEIDGRKWVYNTFDKWQEQFPFWGYNTIRRIVEKLKKSGIILTGNFNSSKIDNTTWYTIDYEKVDELTTAQNGQSDCENSLTTAQNGQSDSPKWVIAQPNLGRPIPEITTENTSEKKEEEEKERERKPNPFIVFQENIGPLTPIISEDISKWIEGNYFDEPEKIVADAIAIAVRNGVRNWNYASKALIDWADRGFRTILQVRAAIQEYESKKGAGKDAINRRSTSRVAQTDTATSITGKRRGWIRPNTPD